MQSLEVNASTLHRGRRRCRQDSLVSQIESGEAGTVFGKVDRARQAIAHLGVLDADAAGLFTFPVLGEGLPPPRFLLGGPAPASTIPSNRTRAAGRPIENESFRMSSIPASGSPVSTRPSTPGLKSLGSI